MFLITEIFPTLLFIIIAKYAKSGKEQTSTGEGGNGKNYKVNLSLEMKDVDNTNIYKPPSNV